MKPNDVVPHLECPIGRFRRGVFFQFCEGGIPVLAIETAGIVDKHDTLRAQSKDRVQLLKDRCVSFSACRGTSGVVRVQPE